MTKERLKAYRAIVLERRLTEGKIKRTQGKIEEIEAELYSPKAQQLTGMPAAPSRANKGLEEVVGRCEDKLREQRGMCAQLLQHYEQLGVELAAEQLAIEQAINGLTPTERTLMREHYIEGKKWEDVCVLIGYSWRQTHRLHAEILQKLKAQA